jgi:hypothetical protein
VRARTGVDCESARAVRAAVHSRAPKNSAKNAAAPKPKTSLSESIAGGGRPARAALSMARVRIPKTRVMQKAACHASTTAGAQAGRRHNTTIATPPKTTTTVAMRTTGLAVSANQPRRAMYVGSGAASLMQQSVIQPVTTQAESERRRKTLLEAGRGLTLIRPRGRDCVGPAAAIRRSRARFVADQRPGG